MTTNLSDCLTLLQDAALAHAAADRAYDAACLALKDAEADGNPRALEFAQDDMVLADMAFEDACGTVMCAAFELLEAAQAPETDLEAA